MSIIVSMFNGSWIQWPGDQPIQLNATKLRPVSWEVRHFAQIQFWLTVLLGPLGAAGLLKELHPPHLVGHKGHIGQVSLGGPMVLSCLGGGTWLQLNNSIWHVWWWWISNAKLSTSYTYIEIAIDWWGVCHGMWHDLSDIIGWLTDQEKPAFKQQSDLNSDTSDHHHHHRITTIITFIAINILNHHSSSSSSSSSSPSSSLKYNIY